MTIIVHMSTEEAKARSRMGLVPETIEEVADTYVRNRTRELYGSTENTIQLIVPKR